MLRRFKSQARSSYLWHRWCLLIERHLAETKSKGVGRLRKFWQAPRCNRRAPAICRIYLTPFEIPIESRESLCGTGSVNGKRNICEMIEVWTALVIIDNGWHLFTLLLVRLSLCLFACMCVPVCLCFRPYVCMYIWLYVTCAGLTICLYNFHP